MACSVTRPVETSNISGENPSVSGEDATRSGYYQDKNGRWHRPITCLHQMKK